MQPPMQLCVSGQANAGLAAALPKRGTTGVTMNLEQVAPAAETEGNREFF